MRVFALLLKAFSPPAQIWTKNDLYDALFYLRILVAITVGAIFGTVGAQGLMAFVSYVGINLFVGNAWLKWQSIDESDYEDPDKISQSPLAFEGFAPSMMSFVLVWVVSFNIAH